MKGTRVVYCDSRNNKLLWKAALERACRQPDPPARPRQSWWTAALVFFTELFG